MSIWDTITKTISGIWDSPKPAFDPISVPVTAKDQEVARQMNERADAWTAAGHTGTLGDEQRQANRKKGAGLSAGFSDPRAQEVYREGAGTWDKALDLFLQGKGPNPGPRDEYIRKHNPDPDRPAEIPDRLRAPSAMYGD
jgi:hypothetical protein